MKEIYTFISGTEPSDFEMSSEFTNFSFQEYSIKNVEAGVILVSGFGSEDLYHSLCLPTSLQSRPRL